MLFNDDNYYFENLNINDSNLSKAKFLRGNMFDNEFVSFEGIGYVMPKISSDKDKLLFDIMKSSFAINDYNLYLDLHPNDHDILYKYQNEVKKCKELSDQYTRLYGPLTLKDSEYNTVKWSECSFPWEVD